MSTLFALNKAHLGLAFLFPALSYLLLRKKIHDHQEIGKSHSPRMFTLLTILFISIIIATAWEWNTQLYQRSILFFLLFTAASVLVVVKIFAFQSDTYTVPILIEMLAIAIILRASVYFNFPTVYGHDPFFHIAEIEKTIENGFLSLDLGRYVGFPLFHLLTASVNQILGLELKNAYFISSIVEVLCGVFIFATIRILFNTKTALLGTFLFLLAPYNVFWGFWIIPMTLGAAFFVIIIYLIIKRTTFFSQRRFSLLLLFFLLTSIFIHPILSFVLLAVFTIFYFASRIFLRSMQNTRVISLLLVFLVASASFVYWMSIPDFYGLDVFSSFTWSMILSLSRLGDPTPTAVSLAPTYDYLSILLTDLPFTILIFFGVLGSVLSLTARKTQTKPLLQGLALTLIALLVVIYGAGLVGIDAVLPQRWFVFVEVFIALFGAYSILSLLSLIGRGVIRYLVVIGVFSILIFSITTSPVTNTDSAFYSTELARRAAYYESEINAAEFLQRHYNETVRGGFYLVEGERLDPRVISTYNESLIALRAINLETGFYIPLFGSGGLLYEIVFPNTTFYNQINAYSKVYDNIEVQVYAH